MCGIFGFVYRERAPRPNLGAAVAALLHRGPDDHGTILDESGEWVCGLAHTRLSVVDLSKAGHQPMASKRTPRHVIFNGEIYNFRELRDELRTLGHVFTSDTDTEVILAAYDAWGPASVERMLGMFAFALWDARDRSLFLARDRLGVKPLYVATSPHGIAFASEVRALMLTGCVDRRLSIDGVATFLASGAVREPYSIIENVRSLEPGTYLEVRAGEQSTKRYWDLSLKLDRTLRREDAVARVAELMSDSVRLRLRTDVPTGVFLSSGIDSAALVATASKHSAQPLRTFTVVLSEKGYDEGPAAARIAKTFGCEHTEVRIAPDEVVARVGRAVAAMDQPTADGVNTYIVSESARASGLVVALSGVGADEAFGGYLNFRRFPWTWWLSGLATLPPGARRGLTRMSGLARLSPEVRRAAALIVTAGDPGAVYGTLRSMFVPGQVERLMARHAANSDASSPVRRAVRVADALARGDLDAEGAYGALDMSNYLLNTILHDTDVMSMAHSLEIREPFLDHRLVEFVMSVPFSVKARGQGNKPLLTSAIPDVPMGTRLRKKIGFTLPFDPWLRGPLRAFADDRLSASTLDRIGLLDRGAVQDIASAFYAGSRSVSWSRIWSLVVLSDWCTRNNVTA